MTDLEVLLLAELHADGDPAARRHPDCARVLVALDLVKWELRQLGTE